MSHVYISSLSEPFGKALGEFFTKAGYDVTDTLCDGLEYFIDVTDFHPEGDDTVLGEGLSESVMAEAFLENVRKPLERLSKVLPSMTGKKRICFISSSSASVGTSPAVSGYACNMSKAALHQALMIMKNRYYEEGWTFRLFDPESGSYPVEKAAGAAYVYFTRTRFFDNTPNKSREDEQFLRLRNAHGEEIPW